MKKLIYNIRCYLCEVLFGWAMITQPKDYYSSLDESMKKIFDEVLVSGNWNKVQGRILK